MWKIEFYKTVNGAVPAEDFLDSIEIVKLKAKMIRELDLLEEFGNQLREPHTKLVVDDRASLFELRAQQSSNISRIFFFFREGKKIILLNGIVKKQDKTPPEAIDLAYSYKKDYEKRNLK